MSECQLCGTDLWKGDKMGMDWRDRRESHGQRDLGLLLEMREKHWEIWILPPKWAVALLGLCTYCTVCVNRAGEGQWGKIVPKELVHAQEQEWYVWKVNRVHTVVVMNAGLSNENLLGRQWGELMRVSELGQSHDEAGVLGSLSWPLKTSGTKERNQHVWEKPKRIFSPTI